MMIGELFIAMGFGYWVLTHATMHERGRLRKIGQWIATVMIVGSLALSALKVYHWCQYACPMGGKMSRACPFPARGFAPGLKPAAP